MQNIPLQVTPNQSFPITLDNTLYTITLRTIGDLTYLDVDINGVSVVSGLRCTPNVPLIPYRYMEGAGGNFAFATSGEYPNYEQFGVTQLLIYATVAELAALRATS
jgi:hypothetical protein